MYDYTLRYSKRVKHLQLRISRHGLEVVVPIENNVPKAIIDSFIKEKETWIKRNWERFHSQHGETEEETLPNLIHLQAINETWTIKYFHTKQNKLNLFVNECREITLIGSIDNKKTCIRKLQQWLIQTAEPYLQEQLQILSHETGLHYEKLIIRNNSSRWGSCSTQKHISLCCKLLFLPHTLMRHILLHELCHTKVMHHGNSFWRLLMKFDPLARENAKALRRVNMQIPQWIK